MDVHGAGTEQHGGGGAVRRYDDTLVREDGKWKFKRRVASNDIPSAGPPPVLLTK